MKVTARRRLASAGSAQTVRTASAIMVPPLASSASMCARAWRFISGLAGWGVGKRTVAVRDLGLIAETHAGPVGLRALHVDRVQRRDDVHDGHARVDVDGDADVVAGARALGGDGRRDARGVGHACRVGRPAGACVTGRCARDEAWPDYGRERELERAVAEDERLDVLDADLDRRPQI